MRVTIQRTYYMELSGPKATFSTTSVRAIHMACFHNSTLPGICKIT